MVGLLACLGVDLVVGSIEGRLAVLGGVLVGIDLDVCDGTLGRQSAGALKSVDGDDYVGGIAAHRRGQLLKLAQEVVRIVGERLEAGAVDGLGGAAGRGVGGWGIVVSVYVHVGLNGFQVSGPDRAGRCAGW